jgi:hypothetical protein
MYPESYIGVFMSLQKIKVSKSELLDIVKDNKKKHDEIYEAAEAGYWIDAEDYLKKHLKEQTALLKKNYIKQVKDFKKQISKELKQVEQKKKDSYYYMRKPFPENHSDDYQGTIKRLELCVEPQIELENNEFDCYVRNKWTWRSTFLATNSGYAISASWVTGSAISASYAINSTPLSGSMMTSLANF